MILNAVYLVLYVLEMSEEKLNENSGGFIVIGLTLDIYGLVFKI